MSTRDKAVFVTGVLDGLDAAASLVKSDVEAKALKAVVARLFHGIEVGQLVQCVEWFYQTRANRNVPACGAVLYCAIAGWSGIPQSEKDATLHELRRKSR